MSFYLSGGVEVLGFISPTEITDEYPVIDPLYGIDGLRNVDLLGDLNNIPTPRRRPGMIVGVSGGTQYYKLNSPPWNNTISDWSIFNSGGGAFTGGTVTGNTIFTSGVTANTFSTTTIGTSGDCVDDIYVSNIHSCSPLNINPLDEGNVYFGSTSGVTIDLTNNRVGIGTTAPSEKLDVSGKTKTINLQITSGATAGYVLTALDSSGNTKWEALGSTSNELDPVLTITGTTASTVNIGDRFLISGGTGIWLGKDNQITEYTGVTPTDYSYYIPVIDDVVFVTDTLTTYRFDGTNWVAWRGTAILQNGNSLTTSVNIGSNNNKNLTLRTSGQTRVNIDTSGTTNMFGTTNLVQAQGLNFLTFSSSTPANSGQTMYIRQTAANQYLFGSTGIGFFMRVGPLNVVDFEGQRIQTTGAAILSTTRLGDPNILTLNGIPSGVTAGTQDFRGVLVNPTVNFGGTYSGNFIGYLHNPTITSMANGRHIAMQIVSGDVLLNTTSGNVGIGTTTPSEKLDVSGKTKTINLQVTSGATTGYVLTSDASGNATWQIPSVTADTYTTGFTYQDNTFTISDNSGNTLNATINSVTGLTVNGILSASTISGGTLYGDGSNLTGLSSGLNVGTTQITNGTSGRVLFQSGTTLQQDSNLFWDSTNSRLSIGQGSSPGARLDVKAQGTLSTDIAFRVRNSSDTADLISFRSDGSQWIQSVPFIHAAYLTGTNNTTQGLFLGYNVASLSTTSTNAVIIGRGSGAILQGNGNTIIGDGFSHGTISNSIGLGRGVFVNGSNQFVSGSELYPTNTWLVSTGGEVNSGSNLRGLDFKVSGMAGGPSNISAATYPIRFYSPNGTGSGAGSNIQFHVAPSNTGGAAFNRNIFSEMFTIRGEADGLNHYQLSTPRIPSASLTDGYIQYSADRGGTAGRASAHFRSEDGTINVLGDRTGINTSTPQARLHVANADTTLTTGLFSGTGQNILTVIGSGNTTTSPIFTVQGSSGELFSVSDSLVGSLFSVNDISGLPIFEVFSDNTTLMGSYLAPSLNTTARVIATTGTTNVYSIPTSAYTGAFFDYTVSDGTNLRAGNIMSIWSGTSVNITETQTTDFGNTSGLTFNMVVSSGNAILRTSGTTGNWTVKTIVRSI